MILQTVQTVQTTGINWESVSAIIVAFTTVLGLLLTWLSRSIGNQITRAIDRLRIEVIAKLERRVTLLEAIVMKRFDGDE